MMDRKYQRGDLVVYMRSPSSGRNWSVPQRGQLLRVTDAPLSDKNIWVKAIQPTLGDAYHNFLPKECFVPFEIIHKEYMTTKEKLRVNCCWTCKHFGSAENCAKRRALKKLPATSLCPKFLSDEGGGFTRCAGGKNGEGCGTGKMCWERWCGISSAKEKLKKAFAQANLIFPKAPTG